MKQTVGNGIVIMSFVISIIIIIIILIMIFFPDKPGIISSFEIQGRSSSDVYLKQFRVRYKADDDQQTQDYKVRVTDPKNHYFKIRDKVQMPAY